ncbi:accessory factor UbiK family protein [Falsiroseomonas tokyonensis]|uniref:Accessory factor UbiK family protein n=1 Tax=Falsiroseomonas tokyonensis TaxID=430521 RepID=A0ABV7BZR9_9PROT|nr:accessory factor UbiK family protein [Falsiroseomonas tokyonensis]MBU8539700.1 accessory factor UbiK family protein [Falsiroseomonas tokyonensis]
MGGGSGPKRGLFDDLAGMAGGAFSVLAGARAEAEAMGRAQVEAMVQRLELVRREDLDAALEVARRAREQAEALEVRVAALEAKLAQAAPAADASIDPGQSVDGG